MDVLAVTDFPDIRTKCAIQSGSGGNILLIPREGGYLFRMYVDLGEVATGQDHGAVRATTHRADHRQGERDPAPVHARREERRLAQRLRGRAPAHRPLRRRARRGARHPHAARLHRRRRLPHAQREGRPGHERVDAGRLQHRLEARARARRPQPRSACSRPTRPSARWSRRTSSTSTSEWSTLMAKRPEEFDDPSELEEFYVRTAEFPAGFMTAVRAVDASSATPTHQELATGFPIGKRFKSAPVDPGRATATPCTSVTRPAPTAAGASTRSPTPPRRATLGARRLGGVAGRRAGVAARRAPRRAPTSTRVRRQGDLPAGPHRRRHHDRARRCSCPRVGPFELIDYEKVYATEPERRHLRAARHRPRRRRRRRAPRPVRRERAAADGDRAAGRVLRPLLQAAAGAR